MFAKAVNLARGGVAGILRWYSGADTACPILLAYTTALSDAMPNDLRQRLVLPLVPLIAEVAEDPRRRAEFLAIWMDDKVGEFAFEAAEKEIGVVAREDLSSLAAALALERAVERVLGSPDEGVVPASAVAAFASARVAQRASATLGSEEPWRVAVDGLRRAI